MKNNVEGPLLEALGVTCTSGDESASLMVQAVVPATLTANATMSGAASGKMCQIIIPDQLLQERILNDVILKTVHNGFISNSTTSVKSLCRVSVAR